MGLTEKQKKERSNDPNVKYIVENLCDKDKDKDYIFISYKSDDWKVVLQDAVYRLVKDYGLNVYFDGSFDIHNSSWVRQFPANMDDPKCKGVLAFVDNKYATSYATLLELMFSQLGCLNDRYRLKPKPVVHVRLEDLETPKEKANTYLGWRTLEDGTINELAEDEYDFFVKTYTNGDTNSNKIFKEAKRPIEQNVIEDRKLDTVLCSEMVQRLLEHIKVNKKPYSYGEDLSAIASSIKDACGESVFSRKTKPLKFNVNFVSEGNSVETLWVESGKTIEQPPIYKDGYELEGWFSNEENQETQWNFDTAVVLKNMTLVAKWHEKVSNVNFISLTDFIKKYNSNTFNKQTYRNFKLVGKAEFAKYGTDIYDSAYELVWEFVMKLLAEKGIDYINEVNAKHSGIKNPAFIEKSVYDLRDDQKKYRNIELPGMTDYYMYRHYGQYDWIYAVLRPRLEEFGLPLNAFGFVYNIVDDSVPENTDDLFYNDGVTVPTRSITESNKYEYTLWGEKHTSYKLNGLMHDVFDLIAEKYPQKVVDFVNNDGITSVALKRDVDQGKMPQKTLEHFDAGKREHTVNGVDYYVCTHYGREAGVSQLKKMLEICEGGSSAFSIELEPPKKIRNKNNKKGLEELFE